MYVCVYVCCDVICVAKERKLFWGGFFWVFSLLRWSVCWVVELGSESSCSLSNNRRTSKKLIPERNIVVYEHSCSSAEALLQQLISQRMTIKVLVPLQVPV